MKRMTALVLSLLVLFSMAAACAESTASTLALSNLSISYVGDGRARSVRLNKMSLSMSLGSADGVPTLQMSFDNGRDQQVDCIIQIVGDRLLLSMGGISGVYYVDLESIAGEQGDGSMIARGIGSALALAGPHLDVLLFALTTEDAKGVRSMEITLPNEIYVRLTDRVLAILDGIDSSEDIDVETMRERVEQSEGRTVLSIRYKESTGKLELALLQNRRGIQLSADMELTVQPAAFVNISEEEEQYDLLNMDAARLDELRGELEIIALKFGQFAGGTGLNRLIG